MQIIVFCFYSHFAQRPNLIGIHTKLPSSIAPRHSSVAHVPTVGIFNGGLGLEWALWPVCDYKASYAAGCYALWAVMHSSHAHYFIFSMTCATVAHLLVQTKRNCLCWPHTLMSLLGLTPCSSFAV